MIENAINSSVSQYVPNKIYQLGDLTSLNGVIFRANKQFLNIPPNPDCCNDKINNSLILLKNNWQQAIQYSQESFDKAIKFFKAWKTFSENIYWTSLPTISTKQQNYSFPLIQGSPLFTLFSQFQTAISANDLSSYISVANNTTYFTITYLNITKNTLQIIEDLLYSWIPATGIKMNDSFLGPQVGDNGYVIPKNFYSIGNLEQTQAEKTYHILCSENLDSLSTVGVAPNVIVKNNVLFGAAWNDYAEYRKTVEDIQAGNCVIENGDGTLKKSDDRLLPGGNIVSDTFGFAIGQTQETMTPLAVAGRVLAYPYENKEIFMAGDAVCSGPNGTVSRMTREEIKEWPDRIIGYVSEIPNYEIWGENSIKVNGRIWIKVK